MLPDGSAEWMINSKQLNYWLMITMVWTNWWLEHEVIIRLGKPEKTRMALYFSKEIHIYSIVLSVRIKLPRPLIEPAISQLNKGCLVCVPLFLFLVNPWTRQFFFPNWAIWAVCLAKYKRRRFRSNNLLRVNYGYYVYLETLREVGKSYDPRQTQVNHTYLRHTSRQLILLGDRELHCSEEL